MMVKTFRVSCAMITNQCYLVYQNNAGILVDPAWEYDLFNTFLHDHQIVLKAVLLTHSHFDHSNLAREFAERNGVPVFMSGIEIDQYGFRCPNLQRVSHLQDIVLSGFRIIPLLTAGHTEGSICYLIDHHLFTGDTVFIEGVGMCDASGVDQLYDSVQFLKQNLPGYVLFWPGHSFGQQPGKDLDFILKNNLYFQLDDRKYFTDFRMRKRAPNPFLFGV